MYRCDYSHYTPQSLNNVDSPNTQFFLIFLRRIVFSLKDSYNELDFKVTHNAGVQIDYVTEYDIRLVTLAPIALFSDCKLTTSSGETFRAFRLGSSCLPNV